MQMESPCYLLVVKSLPLEWKPREGLSNSKQFSLHKSLQSEKVQSVKAMYADHVSVDKIAKYVSLPEAEVQAILSAK